MSVHKKDVSSDSLEPASEDKYSKFIPPSVVCQSEFDSSQHETSSPALRLGGCKSPIFDSFHSSRSVSVGETKPGLHAEPLKPQPPPIVLPDGKSKRSSLPNGHADIPYTRPSFLITDILADVPSLSEKPSSTMCHRVKPSGLLLPTSTPAPTSEHYHQFRLSESEDEQSEDDFNTSSISINGEGKTFVKSRVKECPSGLDILPNECLTTPQHKNKPAIECQTNGIYIKRKKSNVYKLKIKQVNYRITVTKD